MFSEREFEDFWKKLDSRMASNQKRIEELHRQAVDPMSCLIKNRRLNHETTTNKQL